MAHLKKFSLAKKLSKLNDDRRRLYDICMFGIGNEETLFYSSEPVIDISIQAKKLFLDLEFTMKQLKFGYLSANQVGLDWRVFCLQGGSWSNASGQSHMLINPEICEVSKDTSFDWETNQCFPFIQCQIERYNEVVVHYRDFNDDYKTRFEGISARMVQQAIDQMNGWCIIDPRIHQGKWELNDKWKGVLPKTQTAVEHYAEKIHQLTKVHPDLFKLRSVQQLNKGFKEEAEDFSFEEAMFKRLARYVKREMIDPLKAEDEEEEDDLLAKIKGK